MSNTRKPPALFAALLLLLCAVGARAQETTATITGQVTDQAGAAVADAEITLTNTKTREERTTKTGEDGYYSLTFISPGIYDMTVRSQGFKEYLNKTLELFVNDRKTINIALEAGAVSETVTVTAEAPTIQTSPTVGDVIENRRIIELPLGNRNFQQLVTLVPGVSNASEGAVNVGLTNTVNISINGTRRNAINWLVDGVSNTDVGSSITLLSVPTIDSIQEFRVITSVPTAEFGRAGGGVVNLITRGGTRDFHGGVYEFLRNDKLNANPFFNNAAGRFTTDAAALAPDVIVPSGDPRAGKEVRPRSQLRYNNFGWNFGGPIWIPKLYEQRDKTFFFFSQEWRRILRPASLSLTVPTLRQRAGDFSEVGNVRIFDPITGQQFSGNRIPDNRVDPTARLLLTLIPLPNAPSTTAGREDNRFVTNAPEIQNTRQETMRGDHSFNANHRLMARYTHDLSDTREFGGLFFGTSFPNTGTTDTSVPGEVLAVSLTSTFGSNIVNEVSFNFSGNAITSNLVGQYTRANFPLPGEEIFPENLSGIPPTVVVQGAIAFVVGAGQLFDVNYKNFNPKDNITWVRGAHTIKAGADVSWERKNENAAAETQGRLSFSAAQTRGPAGTGIGFADFLLGRASAYTESAVDVTNHLRFGRTEFYVQDTWKARPNLQLDYGIRYQLFRQPRDAENVLTAFLPELFNPAFAPKFANAQGSRLQKNSGDLLNGIAVAGAGSPFGRRVQKLDKNDWAPRLGFSWDPWNSGKTVIRGGYGIYYDQALVGIVEQNAFTNPPFNSSVALTGTIPAPIPFSNPAAGAEATTDPIRNLITTSSPFVTPIIQQWNLTIQRQLTNRSSFEIGYAGSGGNHLVRPVDINAPTPEEIVRVSRGIATCDPALATSNNPNNCINLARPFLGYGSIRDRQTTGTSRYHGLLTSFRLQPTYGLTAQLSYTWSKNITDASNDRDESATASANDQPQIRTDFSLERAVSRLDRTHVFVASYVYEVPYPKEGFFANSIMRQVFGGWQVAGITTAQSGLPVARIILDTGPGPRGNRPNVVSDPLSGVPANVEGVRNPFFFNPLAFRPTAVGQIGNAGRSQFRFPHQVFTDLEFAKNWRWGESYRIQLRAEFFNVFNHATFNAAGITLPANRLPNDPIFNSLDAFVATGSTFGQFTGTRDPREIQLGIKFNF